MIGSSSGFEQDQELRHFFTFKGLHRNIPDVTYMMCFPLGLLLLRSDHNFHFSVLDLGPFGFLICFAEALF